MKIAFLLQVASDARSHKRINVFKNLGVTPVILAFEREFYKGKEIHDRHESLGRIEHSKYYKRFFPFLSAIFKLRARLKNVDAFYAFGLDVLLLGCLASWSISRPVKIVYEVADIREILLGDSWLPRCMRWLERFLLKRTDLLVVTSHAYITNYYEKIQRISSLNYLVIENKLDPGVHMQSPGICRSDSNICIGFFGVIRCRRSWEILKQAVHSGKGKLQVYIRGYPLGFENLEGEAREIPGIEYDGPYVAPDELPFIYNRVDMVWACYPYQGTVIGNYCWARTNRFYESCYFKKPMFAQAGTEDCRVIKELDIGLCLDLEDIEGSVARILNITQQEIKKWEKNLSTLPRNVYMLEYEHKQVLNYLEEKNETCALI